jgi:aldehyde:ferredoxin oxidoreductase
VHFYQGKVLRIDLATGKVAIELLNMDWARLYIGGKGLLFRYLLEEVAPNLDPWSPDNPLMFFTGPFAGTGVSTCSRLVVGCKSPATGTILDSYVGGSFGPELKFAGYDALILTGQAPRPTLVWIKDDVVELRPADKHVGMGIAELEETLRKDLDDNARFMSNGPAGESLLPWACLSTDQYHKAGRGGAGALMGSKNVKAIAIRGTGSVSVGDVKAFMADMRRMHRDYIYTPANMWAHEEGTLALVDMVQVAGAMPTKNWSQGQFEGNDKINSRAYMAVRLKKRACSQCGIGCRNFHVMGSARGEGPEFETVATCGANCGIGDAEALFRFNLACDDLGMDTISTGGVVGLAMDMTERGIHDFGMRFGDVDGYLAAPSLIAKREGIGADLARGARGLAAAYGHPELAMEVKNLELPGYDPRGTFGMSLAYATADRGGCHQRSYVQADEILGGDLPPDSLDGKAAVNIHWQNFTSVKYTGIWCEFWALELDEMRQLLRHVWEEELSDQELMRVGERAWNVSRLFNLRQTVEPDGVPARLVEPAGAFARGPSAGRYIGADRFAAGLAEYYRLRGWDESGVPTEAKLDELGIGLTPRGSRGAA